MVNSVSTLSREYFKHKIYAGKAELSQSKHNGIMKDGKRSSVEYLEIGCFYNETRRKEGWKIETSDKW